MNTLGLANQFDKRRKLMKRRDGVLKFNCRCDNAFAFGVKEQQGGSMRGKRVVCPDCGGVWLIGYNRTESTYIAILL
jgi:hypothetical protein